jgi:hypothetical protein
MRTNTNYANSRIEDVACGKFSKKEYIRIGFSNGTIELLDDYSDTLHMTRTDVVEVLVMYAIKSIAHKKHEKRSAKCID